MDAPHLMILDEPTNHLDIESREALVEALNDYQGAVILITHDAHLVEMVADRLWLVSNGRVTAWDDDMDAYRRHLLGREAPKQKVREPKRKPEPRPRTAPKVLAGLRGDLRNAEERLKTLSAMLAKIDARLTEPGFYNGPIDRVKKLQIKRAEVAEAEARAEALWLDAAEALEQAEQGRGAA